jgi:hypothetical protein
MHGGFLLAGFRFAVPGGSQSRNTRPILCSARNQQLRVELPRIDGVGEVCVRNAIGESSQIGSEQRQKFVELAAVTSAIDRAERLDIRQTQGRLRRQNKFLFGCSHDLGFVAGQTSDVF